MRIFLLTIHLFVSGLLARGDEFFRKDYSDHWIVYDQPNESYVPVIGEINKHRTIHFFLDLIAEAGKKFEICSNGEISILIDGNIIDNDNLNGCLVWEIDSLYQNYRKDSIQLSIYKVDKWVDLKSSILHPALGFVPKVNPIKVRLAQAQSNFIVFALIIIGIALLLIRESNHRFFEEFSSVVKIFKLKVRSSQLYVLKPYSREVFLMIILQSLGVSFFVISIGPFFPQVEGFIINIASTFWGLVGQWILMAFIFTVVLYLQFIVLFVTNLFFSNSRILHIQFYDNLRIIHFYLTALFIFVILFYVISSSIFLCLISELLVLAIGMFALKSVVIYLKMLNESSHRNLHIFSYFCATEILPVALVVKIIFY